ncbi:hypothetical protein ACFYT4_33235 [Streptomyces sp. NPDC004609]|uniref:hypothetical protein n=1 Tax=Streptomyces sp. NPDC004609 TaxID=3364704 RepID=UPI00368F501C
MKENDMTAGPEPSSSSSPNPPMAGAGQSIHISGGDNSPVNVTAPFAHAERGGTASANANANQPTPVPPVSGWSRAAVVWTAVGALGTIAAVIVAILALGK